MFSPLVAGQMVSSGRRSVAQVTLVSHILVCTAFMLLQTPRVSEGVLANIALEL